MSYFYAQKGNVVKPEPRDQAFRDQSAWKSRFRGGTLGGGRSHPIAGFPPASGRAGML